MEIKYSNFDFTNSAYKAAKDKAIKASDKIIEFINSGESFYKIFSNSHALAQVESSSQYAKEIKANFSNLIIIGMGGASLNPESLISFFLEQNDSTQIYFLNNTDPFFLQDLLSKISLKDSAVLAISNSGQTLETISLMGVMIAEFEKANIENFGKHFYCITSLNSGILKDVATKIGATLIEHTPNISGRYSGLTNVSTLAAQIVDIDVKSYLSGANLILEDFIENRGESMAALSAAAFYSMDRNMVVNIGYLQRFSVFLEWYSQIIAESLGKDGKGITPIKGLGPNDQHSMMQLYLDGPKDKIYNIFYVKEKNPIYKSSNIDELQYISGKNLHDINTANFKATLHALIKVGAPTRTIMLDEISAKNIGSLVMHSMLEVITLGHMMQINPFNQPGVELIKTESMRLVVDS